VGDSTESAVSVGIIAAIKPTPPINLARVYSDGTMITIQWIAPVDNGGVPVTDYQVKWDYGSSGASFVSVATTTSGQLLYTKNSDLIAGLTYQFKVLAVNAIGVSDPSIALSVIAAQEPLTPNAPTKLSADETHISI